MKRKIIYILTTLFILMIIFTAKCNADTATVTTEKLNLREEASTTSTIIEKLNKDDKLDVISQEGDWYKVKHNSNTGYVNKQYIKIAEDDKIITTNEDNNQVKKNESTLVKDSNIRILPAINSDIIGEVKAETIVKVISKTDKWEFIQKDDITGWIPLAYTQENQANVLVDTATEEDTNNTNQNTSTEDEGTANNTDTNTTVTGTKYINTESVYVRSEPTTDSKTVATLIKNTDVKVTGEENGWYKITYNDISGYIRKDLLSDKKTTETSRSGETIDRDQAVQVVNSNTTSNSTGTEIVNYATQYLGCPYVYGASGSSSFDCSGFTMYVYKHFGYSLSHSATAQSNCGIYVAKENLQPGDLVFFLDYETMDGIGHCGIYIGNGNFIHASSGSGYCVKTSTLLSGSYLNRYATARRII